MYHWKKQYCIEELKKDISDRGFIYPAATVTEGVIV